MFNPDNTFDSYLRLDLGKLIELNNNFYDILTSNYVKHLHSLPIAGTYQVITEMFRPDLISYKIYKDVQYKLLLMEYNSIIKITEIVPGLVLKYPSLQDLQSLVFQLNTKSERVTKK